MMSLFSPFDSYLSNFSVLVVFFMVLSATSGLNKMSVKNLVSSAYFGFIFTFLSSFKPKMFNDMSLIAFSSIFMYLVTCNFVSVFPFFFPLTSQVALVSFLSFSLWLSFILFAASENLKGLISHCVPEGSPIYLIWLLFLIELVSNFIRPITLTVRLSANILAGHLLMILLSKSALYSLIGLSLYLFLNLVEMFVSVIQAYIFVTMISLYFSDVN